MSVVKSLEDVADGQHLETPTWVTSFQGLPRTVNVRRCRLEVVAGPDVGKVIELAQPTILIGRTGADLNLTDPKVSGLHAELRLQADGYRIRDLGSTNGTHVRGVRIVDGFIAPGSTIQIGKSAIVFDPLDDCVSVPLWHESRLHGLIGGSAAMRHLFDLINRFAQSRRDRADPGRDRRRQGGRRRRDPPVLAAPRRPVRRARLLGDPRAAVRGPDLRPRAGRVHRRRQAPRSACSRPRTAARCSSTRSASCRSTSRPSCCAPSRPARSAASARRRSSRPTSASSPPPTATSRPRSTAARSAPTCSTGSASRSSRCPSLRERREDIPLLVEHFLRQLVATHGSRIRACPTTSSRAPSATPGRATSASCATPSSAPCLLPNHPTLGFEAPPKKEGTFGEVDIDIPFKVAKQKLVDEFDRKYLEALLEAHDNNISAAARAAGIERMSIYKMIRRLGLDKQDEDHRAPTTTDDDDGDGDTNHR